MLSTLRKINMVLFILVALQGVILLHAQPVNAVTAFLYEPFYGNWQESTKKYNAYPITRNASFDHEYPGASNTDSFFTFRNGTKVPNTTCTVGESICYNGHTGIDYELIYAPVVASASGTVVYTGWANTNHETDFGLMVRINHANNYRTIYGHLSAIVAYTNQVIGPRDPNFLAHEQIGTSGNTGNSTNRHLHFEVQTLHNNVWKPTDPFGWTGTAGQDPWENLSPAGGVKSENLWVAAPRQFPPPGDGPVVVDDGNANFSTSGTWNLVTTAGYNNDLRWRYTTSSAISNGWAKWNPTVPITTRYEAQAFIPNYDMTNLTHAARYEIYSNGTLVRTVIVDQHDVQPTSSPSGRWISLGRYSFPQGTNSYVRVTDSTFGVCNNAYTTNCQLYTEPSNTKKIIVDAVRFYAN